MRKDNAFTGLEAAIVLIAFVVVAAIFSYVMLGAGFFATQKAQEVTYSAIKETTSIMVQDGTIYGNYDGTSIDMLQFSVTVPVNGQAQDLKDMVVTYAKENVIPFNYNMDTTVSSGFFRISSCTTGTVNSLLPPGHSCNIILEISDSAIRPTSGDWFQLEIKPPIGVPTPIKKTIPTGYQGGKIL